MTENHFKPYPMDIENKKIEIRVMNKKSAIEINSINSNREFLIQDVMLGTGHNRKPVIYTDGMLKYGSEHQAEILKNGKLRII